MPSKLMKTNKIIKMYVETLLGRHTCTYVHVYTIDI